MVYHPPHIQLVRWQATSVRRQVCCALVRPIQTSVDPALQPKYEIPNSAWCSILTLCFALGDGAAASLPVARWAAVWMVEAIDIALGQCFHPKFISLSQVVPNPIQP